MKNTLIQRIHLKLNMLISTIPSDILKRTSIYEKALEYARRPSKKGLLALKSELDTIYIKDESITSLGNYINTLFNECYTINKGVLVC